MDTGIGTPGEGRGVIYPPALHRPPPPGCGPPLPGLRRPSWNLEATEILAEERGCRCLGDPPRGASTPGSGRLFSSIATLWRRARLLL